MYNEICVQPLDLAIFEGEKRLLRTAITNPSFTSRGSFFPRALRWNSFRAPSSVAVSIYVKGSRLAFRIVSTREVAVTMCEDPAVREVKRYNLGSSSQDSRSPMIADKAGSK